MSSHSTLLDAWYSIQPLMSKVKSLYIDRREHYPQIADQLESATKQFLTVARSNKETRDLRLRCDSLIQQLQFMRESVDDDKLDSYEESMHTLLDSLRTYNR